MIPVRRAAPILAMLAVAIAGCPSESDDGGAAGHGGGEGTGGGGGHDDGPPAWQVVFDDGALDRTLLSIWGTGPDSVYAVGGPLGNEGFEALALHYDGSAWTDMHAGGTDTFWWVTGTGDDDLWMVGERGRITHYDGAAFAESEPITTATLWGAVAFATDDVWAVGGMVGGPSTQPDDVVLHFDGSSWQAVTLPGEPLGRALFKVWGTGSDDLYVVGEAGVIWHKDGDTWIDESGTPPVATGNLTTVHGCGAADVYAVGGRDLLQRDATGWIRSDKLLSNDVNGVFCAGAGEAAIVGTGGLKQRLVAGTWEDDFTKDPHGNLHAVWGDGEGSYWAVGGDFFSTPKPNVARNGIIARYGKGHVSTALQ